VTLDLLKSSFTINEIQFMVLNFDLLQKKTNIETHYGRPGSVRSWSSQSYPRKIPLLLQTHLGKQKKRSKMAGAGARSLLRSSSSLLRAAAPARSSSSLGAGASRPSIRRALGAPPRPLLRYQQDPTMPLSDWQAAGL
jgi:hypothetical protein